MTCKCHYGILLGSNIAKLTPHNKQNPGPQQQVKITSQSEEIVSSCLSLYLSLYLSSLFINQVKVTREKVTWPGAKIRKSGEGMPNYENNNVKGSLYITFDVQFPKIEFSEEEKKCK